MLIESEDKAADATVLERAGTATVEP